MSFLHNAGTVARFEAITLRRSWFFRLFSLGTLVIFTFMNIGIFSPVGDEPWNMVSISSSIPLINLYLLNIGQAIVVIFLAADFLKRDKKLDTNEVLYTRSMSNFEYVLGKTWGIIRLFLGLNLIILGIALIINIISKRMSVDIISYIEYLLIFTIPTITFSLGLAFLLMSVIRNQAITFLLLLGIAALDMFWLWYRAGSIFDYMAFGLPVFKSGVIGFDNPGAIIFQRLLYFFAGMALVMGTVLIFRRLPQSKLHTTLAIIFLFVSLTGAVFCGYKTVSNFFGNRETRKMVIETNRLFENRDFPLVTDASIELTHKGEMIEASARLKIKNDNGNPIDHYLFSLNPLLTVNKITGQDGNLSFKTTNHIIEIEPSAILLPGQYDTLTFEYSGKINEAFCSPNFSDNIKENRYRIAMVNVNKRQYFLKDDYLLLTPETHWYPVASLNYYPSNPARIKINFTRYTLKVKTEKGLNVISQGLRRNDSTYVTYLPEGPLTGLTVAIGDYQSDTLRVDSITYIAHHFRGNDYYKKDLAELKDTLPTLVSGIMRDLETSFSTNYPFKSLALLEVPVQFYSYPRNSTQTRSEVQPGMILLPEKLSTLDAAGFSKRFERQKKGMARNNQVITDKELQVRLFNDFVRNIFINGESLVFTGDQVYNEPSRYQLGPSFYFYKNNFFSSEYPVINAVFESHLQQLVQLGPRQGFSAMIGNLSENDKANLVLKDKSFRELLEQNPGGDTVRVVLAVKGDWFFNLLRSKAGIEEFKIWFAEYCNNHKFERVDILKFREDILERFGFDFYPYLDNWFKGKDQPGFIFSGLQVNEILVNDRLRYLVSFTATNPENVPGLFNIAFRSEGPGGRGARMSGAFQPGGGPGEGITQGRGMEASDISKIVLLEPSESKKISIINDVQPRGMFINTLFAKNIPGRINMPVNEATKIKGRLSLPEEEMIVDAPVLNNPAEIIIDNEDPGFSSSDFITVSPLKKLFGITNNQTNVYKQVSQWMRPEYWQPVVQTTYFGKYIRSAVYTRGGSGDRSVTWATKINDPGYYDVYCYVGKRMNLRRIRSDRSAGTAGPGRAEGMEDEQADSRFKDFHYKVYNDDGIEDITIDYESADAEWNNLGRYYLSTDTARVVLTNQSSGRLVIGDAVKWVRVE
ncbi:MAG TPA: hypothetical protein VMV47_02910 [Bacteroidales bacterium]|nr:hypothetical protein [Bacteroidales bacterium]